LAQFLIEVLGMMVMPSASLASRFLEPLTRPWAVVGASVAGGGVAWSDASQEAIRVALHLLHLLLSL
jgi:hypothetical protein